MIAAATLSLLSASVTGAQRPEVTENPIGMRLVKIPAGEFEMGGYEHVKEKPVHRVQITRAFLLGETEVTQAQWRKVMDSSPWKGQGFVKDGPDDPEGPDSGSFHVIRGGGWRNLTYHCRSAYRGGESPALRLLGPPDGPLSSVGFRVVCELE